MNLNPMFSRTKETTASHRVPKPKIEKVKNPTRKKRADAKKDIKVPLTFDEKKSLKILSYYNNRSVTEFSSNLVINGLSQHYVEQIPQVQYPQIQHFIHVKLTQSQHQKMVYLSAQWDCSIRRATHRILIFLLKEERGIAI